MRKCSDLIESFVEFTANTEPCKAFRSWVAISMVGGTLGRKLVINRGAYHLFPNLYIILVGTSGGARKSTAIKHGGNFLDFIRGKYDPANQTYKIEPRSAYFRGRASLEAIIEEMQRPIIYKDHKGVKTNAMGTIYILAPELSTFLGSASYQQDIIPYLTDIFDCDDEYHWLTRKGGRKVLRNLCVNLLGASTPKWLASSIAEDAIHGGFTGRTIFVMQDEVRTFSEPFLNEKLRPDIYHDFEQISKISGEMLATEEAVEFFKDWYIKHNQILNQADDLEAAFLQRMHDHLVKTAAIISLSESDELLIHPRHLERADALLQKVLQTMGRAFLYVGDPGEIRAKQAKVLGIIMELGGKATKSDVLQRRPRRMQKEDFDATLARLKSAELIREFQEKLVGSNRASTMYEITEVGRAELRGEVIMSYQGMKEEKL